MRLEGLGKLKKKIHLIGTRTRDLPACSIVPQPTTIPRATAIKEIHNLSRNVLEMLPKKTRKEIGWQCGSNEGESTNSGLEFLVFSMLTSFTL
jgi:hypothetical protein